MHYPSASLATDAKVGAENGQEETAEKHKHERPERQSSASEVSAVQTRGNELRGPALTLTPGLGARVWNPGTGGGETCGPPAG